MSDQLQQEPTGEELVSAITDLRAAFDAGYKAAQDALIAFPPCPECGGKGKVILSMEGQGHPIVDCPKCGGLGVEISDELVERMAGSLDNGIKPGPFEWRVKEARRLLAVVVAHLRDGTKGTE